MRLEGLIIVNRCYVVWVLGLLTVKRSCLSVRFNVINCGYDSENLLKVGQILREFKCSALLKIIFISMCFFHFV